jgi:hypothetical protein
LFVIVGMKSGSLMEIKMKANYKILLRIPFLIALAALLINDNYLKTAYPGWLAGKLSDFAGLFVLAVFIYAIIGNYMQPVGIRGRMPTTTTIVGVRGRTPTTKSLLLMHGIIAVGFILWKIAPVELLFAAINKLIPIPLPGRVKDSGDLIALAVLPVSYFYIIRFNQNRQIFAVKPKLTRFATATVMLLACIAMIATTPGRRYDIQPGITYPAADEWPQIRVLFEQTLADKQVEIEDSHPVDDSTYLYKVFFRDKKVGKYKDGKPKYQEYTSFITIAYSPGESTIAFKDIRGWIVNDMPDDKAIDKAYMRTIVEPFLEKLK